jgi:hypothetical protein
MNIDQSYVYTSHTANDQLQHAQIGSYSNDQVLMQNSYDNNGQPIEQTTQISANQFALAPAGQKLLHHQQPSLKQQYVTSNQGAQLFLPPSIERQLVYQQQAPILPYYIPSNNVLSPSTLMNQPTVTSSPEPTIVNNQMTQVSKKQIDDVSRSYDTRVNPPPAGEPLSPRYKDRYFTSTKLKAVTLNGRNSNSTAYKPQNSRQSPRKNPDQHTMSDQTNQQPVKITSAAYRFASSRYPFPSFTISFKTAVTDTLIIDELVKHAKKQNVELKIAAYRHKQVEEDNRILVFVGDINSFCFLNNDSNWPTDLCGETFVMKKPPTPWQLCVTLPDVALSTEWDEFVHDMKEQYPEVVNVIRLKSASQHLISTVKVEFSCAEARNNVLQEKEMSIGYMKYRTTEYLPQAQVLICGNCYEIGHFKNSCPHGDKITCKICGVMCTDIKDHECSGVRKCIRCGQEHTSTDLRCPVVKTYRAALTQNLLQRSSTNSTQENILLAFTKPRQPFNATTTIEAYEMKLDTLVAKKLDSYLAENNAELNKTRENIDGMREEVRKNVEESKGEIEAVVKKVQMLEVELQDYSLKINRILENVCLTFANGINLSGDDKDYFASEAQKLKAPTGAKLTE